MRRRGGVSVSSSGCGSLLQQHVDDGGGCPEEQQHAVGLRQHVEHLVRQLLAFDQHVRVQQREHEYHERIAGHVALVAREKGVEEPDPQKGQGDQRDDPERPVAALLAPRGAFS